MKPHLLALLQDNYLDLLRCAFVRKLSGCVRNITAFCQLLLRPIISAVLADTSISVKPKYRPIYRTISNHNNKRTEQSARLSRSWWKTWQMRFWKMCGYLFTLKLEPQQPNCHVIVSPYLDTEKDNGLQIRMFFQVLRHFRSQHCELCFFWSQRRVTDIQLLNSFPKTLRILQWGGHHLVAGNALCFYV